MNQSRAASVRGVLLAVFTAVALFPSPRAWPHARVMAFSCDSQGCHRVDTESACLRETTQSGDGEIDLTGDGILESVRLLDDRVAIYHNGVVVWQSPPEWQVVDFALGDPNDDGRGEVLLAFWKPDATQVTRNHPFIIGYREGTYRALWGGSSVRDPIHEVALGDVDGDSVAELVVLDGMGGGEDRAVTVWRWYGWGFSLMWRSSPGRYRDLTVSPGQDGSSATICVTAEPWRLSPGAAWLKRTRLPTEG